MKRWIIAGGLAALLAAVLLTMFAFTGTEPVSTEDIDAIYDHHNQRLGAASFVPGVSKEVVIGKSIDGVGKAVMGKDTSNLEARATVGLYTGPDNGGNSVEERKAWLVVVAGRCRRPADDGSFRPVHGAREPPGPQWPEATEPVDRVLRCGHRRGNPGGCHRALG